jgi:hypothetical protein
VDKNIVDLLAAIRGDLAMFLDACDVCTNYLSEPQFAAQLTDDKFTYFFPSLSLA